MRVLFGRPKIEPLSEPAKRTRRAGLRNVPAGYVTCHSAPRTDWSYEHETT
jgi:hypothetical protein